MQRLYGLIGVYPSTRPDPSPYNCFFYTIMQTLLIVICGLIIGCLIKKCNRLAAENQRLKSMSPKPVAVADRMPDDSDCTVNPRTGSGKYCWGWVNAHPSIPLAGSWHMVPVLLLADDASHWLPWWAIPLPNTAPPTKPQPTGGRLVQEPRP